MENLTGNSETKNTGAWFNKQNHHDFKLIFDPKEAPPEGYVKIKPLLHQEYQKFNEKNQAWEVDPDAEKKAKAIIEKEQIIKAIASRDYRALKAFKLGKKLDDLYPGETDWYKAQIERIKELDL